MSAGSRQVRAAVSRGPDSPLAFEDLEIGALRRGEILVQVANAGVCHTDLACHEGHIPTRTPIVLGHEGAGTVLEVAPDVTSVSVGDRVLMSFTSCGTCTSCLGGDVAYCEHALELNMLGGGLGGSRTYEGSDVVSHFFGQSSFATLSVASVRNVVVVPGDAPLEVLAPLGCGVLTGAGTVFNALRVRAGSSVVIFGAGAVGLAAAMTARISGASPIVVVDVVESRLELAQRIGADVALDGDDPDLLDAIARVTGGGGDYVIEASGNPVGLGNALASVGRHGVCASVGAVQREVPLNSRALRLKGASVRGVIEGDANPQLLLPRLLAHFAKGDLPVDQLVTSYDFADINQAFDDAESGKAIKPVLTFGTTAHR